MTKNEQLDRLLISAIESDNPEILSEIISILSANNSAITENVKDGLSMIIESWQLDRINSPNKTNFLIEVSSFFNEDFPELRSVLPAVVKKTLPADINKTTAVKILKIRDENITLSNFYFKYVNFLELKTDRFFYNIHSTTWGIIGKLDWITGTATLLKLNRTTLQEVELSLILDQIYIFDTKIQLDAVLKASKLPPPNELLNTFIANAYTKMDKEIIKKSLFSLFVPEKMNPTSFKKWLNTSNAKKDLDSSKKITSLKKARSISELHILVKQHTSFTLTQNSIHKIAEVLNTIKPTTSIKDYLLWAETICLISKNLSPDEILSIVPQSSTVRNIIWPIHTKLENSIGIEIWCQLKVSILPAWAKITEIVNDNDYLTGLCFYLPWRDWKAITSRLNIKDLERAFITSPPLSNPEALLWIWKNRQMLSDTTTKWLNHTKFFFAITGGLDTAIWQVAKKELKKMIQENTSFQNHILKKGNESNIIEFLEKLNNTDSFTATEKQSLIVKLSREYPILKKLFETGKVKKIMLSSSKDKANRTKEEIYITSFKSFNEKIKELNDIINVQIPENTKAIATARAHGDLRENAEYAAAKERQKYINEHRAMLEMRIAITRPTDFSDITISDKIIVGTTVHLKYDNNKLDVYHILGAWDSVPEKKYISYETEFGKVLIGKKVGDIVTHPDGITCIVEKILPLSEKIRKTLSKTHLEM